MPLRLMVVAVACILALVLNGAILSLFGQTSSDRAQHSLVGVLLLLGVVGSSSHNRDKPGEAVGVVVLALAPCYLGTVFPDWDIQVLGIGAHRNPLFHSSLSFLVLRLLVGSQMRLPRILMAGYGIGLASHLSLPDSQPQPTGQGRFATSLRRCLSCPDHQPAGWCRPTLWLPLQSLPSAASQTLPPQGPGLRRQNFFQDTMISQALNNRP